MEVALVDHIAKLIRCRMRLRATAGVQADLCEMIWGRRISLV